MSIITTLASLVHAALVIAKPGVWEGIFGMETLALQNSKLTRGVFRPCRGRERGGGDNREQHVRHHSRHTPRSGCR